LKVNSHSTNQVFSRLVSNPKFHYRVHKDLQIPRACVTFRNKVVFTGRGY